jgi:hypothetical protein
MTLYKGGEYKKAYDELKRVINMINDK